MSKLKLGVRIARFTDKTERLHMILVELASLLDMLIFFCSLTYLTSDFRAKILFWNPYKIDYNR